MGSFTDLIGMIPGVNKKALEGASFDEKKIDRKFPGAQPWEIVEPTDNRLQYPIPNSEWSVSGIEQNPGY